jgi:nucleoid-associated protein YgaU
LFLPRETPTTRPSASRPPDTPNATGLENQEQTTPARFHIVQNGETLSAIAQQYYGSASRWRSIVEANRDAIKDPDRISPGTKLIIP